MGLADNSSWYNNPILGGSEEQVPVYIPLVKCLCMHISVFISFFIVFFKAG